MVKIACYKTLHLIYYVPTEEQDKKYEDKNSTRSMKTRILLSCLVDKNSTRTLLSGKGSFHRVGNSR